MIKSHEAYFKYFRKHYGLLYALCYRLMLGFIMTGWNIFWFIKLFGNKKAKGKIKEIMVRNNKFIMWSISMGAGN